MHIDKENYLEHYGVKGMKWRKRKTSSDQTVEKGESLSKASNVQTGQQQKEPNDTVTSIAKSLNASGKQLGKGLKTITSYLRRAAGMSMNEIGSRTVKKGKNRITSVLFK